MHPDDPVCLCFGVTRRKLEAFVRVNRPAVPSLLSQCGGAGTGCGWCVPFLKQLHARAADLDRLSAAEYAAGRALYRGEAAPPPGPADS